MLQNGDPLNTWRTNLPTTLATAGLWGCLLAAMIASKLARCSMLNVACVVEKGCHSITTHCVMLLVVCVLYHLPYICRL